MVDYIQTDTIPKPLYERGYRCQHVRPFAANHKTDEGELFPKRMAPEQAWRKPYVEINPEHLWSVIVLDCDDADRHDWFWLKHPDYPRPSYHVINNQNEHRQSGWVLKTPVHRYRGSSIKAQNHMAQVVSRMTDAFGADKSYAGLLSRNPVYEHHTLNTGWCEPTIKGYSLKQLDLPHKRPVRIEDHGIGRHVTLFKELMAYAGKYANRDADLMLKALQINNQFDERLPINHVQSTVKSVARYRARFRYFNYSSEVQRERQVKSVESRHRKNTERDAMIAMFREDGLNYRAIGQLVGCSAQTVGRVLERY